MSGSGSKALPAPQDFAGILVAARRRAGLTQAEVALAAGLTPSYLSFLENRKKPPPSEDVCRRLAEVLGLRAAQVVEIAQTERAPDSVRQRLKRLDSSLKRERRTRKRLLRSLLSPFLFAGPPGYVSDALDSVGLSPPRRRRLREALTAVGRKRQDRAEEVADIIDALPHAERDRLLQALPGLLTPTTSSASEDAASRDPERPKESSLLSAPPRPSAGTEPIRVRVDDSWTDLPVADGEVRIGDEVVADPSLEPADGDLVVLRNGEVGAVARIESPTPGAFVLVRSNAAGHVWREPARSEESWADRIRDGALAVVVEVRRPRRRRDG